MVQIDIFLDRSQDNRKTWIYSLVWGKYEIQFQRNNYFDSHWILSFFLLISFRELTLKPVEVWFLGVNTDVIAYSAGEHILTDKIQSLFYAGIK